MAVPRFQTMMRPFLDAIGDGREYHWRDLVTPIADALNASEADLEEKMANGRDRFTNRIHWVGVHFAAAGVIERTGRGRLRITERGEIFGREHQGPLAMEDLMCFPEYVAFRKPKGRKGTASEVAEPESSDAPVEGSPEEVIGDAYQRHRALVISELLDQVRKREPAFLESILKDLLPRLGYGETEVTGKTGDEGVDAVVREDLLGFEHIYVQAKRWEHPIGRPEIQRFLGSLVGKHAKKGIFVTTSRFTKEAEEFVGRLEHRIVLIDGDALGRLMYDYKLGVQEKESYRIMTIDHNYFEEE